MHFAIKMKMIIPKEKIIKVIQKRTMIDWDGKELKNIYVERESERAGLKMDM